ncbi:MAG: hypothetical protein L3J41_11775 [Melioribacteraceae bacterium]|nr:hypothetical protein [Melioribacteraceae bacterium]
MLANQYFISERYFEALEEYSKLTPERINDPIIKMKIIICAALNKNFEKALSLLKEIPVDENSSYYGLKLLKEIYLCEKMLEQLEKRKNPNSENDEAKRMLMAILSRFTDRKKSLEYFNGLKSSGYSDIVNDFLCSIKEIKQTTI